MCPSMSSKSNQAWASPASALQWLETRWGIDRVRNMQTCFNHPCQTKHPFYNMAIKVIPLNYFYLFLISSSFMHKRSPKMKTKILKLTSTQDIAVSSSTSILQFNITILPKQSTPSIIWSSNSYFQTTSSCSSSLFLHNRSPEMNPKILKLTST